MPLLYIENVENYWGNYLAVIASFVGYFIATQTHKIEISRIINKIASLYFIVLCIQVVYTYIQIITKYGKLDVGILKYYLVVPVGSSNYIAAIILPFLVFFYMSNISTFHKYILIGLGLLTLVVIQSKNAIIIVIVLAAFSVIKKYLGSIRNRSNINKHLKIISFLPIFIFLLIVSYLGTEFFLNKWYMGMDLNNSSIYEIINALSSNRLEVYSNEFIRWNQHLFFGNGLSYSLGQMRSHNWIIDLLVQSGIFGFLIFILAIFIWLKSIVGYLSKDNFIKSIFSLVLVILIQGLGEVTLFTNTIDILFWFMLGTSVSQKNYLKRNSEVVHEPK
ncbi:O-antigen ligase family protein [Paenibacillus piscarius]|uniref:O-antigen ligase family protein n=1 Tax=Paenibacillus piscarius TaxID=1089681 RepID=UPI001EE7971A|nr:hypothetical protein [Paenibacillus piscarius]